MKIRENKNTEMNRWKTDKKSGNRYQYANKNKVKWLLKNNSTAHQKNKQACFGLSIQNSGSNNWPVNTINIVIVTYNTSTRRLSKVCVLILFNTRIQNTHICIWSNYIQPGSIRFLRFSTWCYIDIIVLQMCWYIFTDIFSTSTEYRLLLRKEQKKNNLKVFWASRTFYLFAVV